MFSNQHFTGTYVSSFHLLVNTIKIVMEKYMHLLLTSSRHLSHYIYLIRLFTTCNSTKLLQIQATGTPVS